MAAENRERKLQLEGEVVVHAEDIFEKGMEEFDDCWIGRKRSPLMFVGLNEKKDIISGALELLIKDKFKMLFVDNYPVRLRITVESA